VQLGAVRTGDRLHRASDAFDLLRELGPDLVPEATGSGGSDHPELERGIVGDQHDGGDRLAVSRHLEAETLLATDQQCTEVDVRGVVLDVLLGSVPRTSMPYVRLRLDRDLDILDLADLLAQTRHQRLSPWTSVAA
jgi:hypothetical protein